MSQADRAQISIAVVIVVAVVFLIVLLVYGHYFSVSDSTTALVILKSETLGQLNEQDDLYRIRRIDFCETTAGMAKFNVITSPDTFILGVGEISDIKDKIAGETKWSSANIDLAFNGPPISCP